MHTSVYDENNFKAIGVKLRKKKLD